MARDPKMEERLEAARLDLEGCEHCGYKPRQKDVATRHGLAASSICRLAGSIPERPQHTRGANPCPGCGEPMREPAELCGFCIEERNLARGGRAA